MFEFSRIFDAVSGVLGGSVEQIAQDGLSSAIEAAGIDPADLQGLGSEQLLQVLSDNGIDVANLTPDQLQELFAHWVLPK